MSSISAGTTTGTALVSTGDTTGQLDLKINGTTQAVRINTSGAIGVGTTPGYGTSGQVLTSGGSSAAPTWSNLPASAGVLEATASGSLANGDKVVVNSDGTVSVVAGASPSLGTTVTFESAGSTYMSSVYDSTNQKVVIFYQDGGNSSYGTAIVGTVSGTSISFGTAVVFNSGATYDIKAVYDSSNSAIVVVYTGGSSYSQAKVGTVSGTSISFGSQTTVRSVAFNTTGELSFDSTNNKVIVPIRDGSNAYGYAYVGTVSGTSISFGSAVAFNSATTNAIASTFDSTNGKVIITYGDANNSYYGTAVVGTVSGTSISFGSPVVFKTAEITESASVFDSTNGKVVTMFRSTGSTNLGYAIVGTVSGTSISFGTEALFNNATTYYTSPVFATASSKVVIVYRLSTGAPSYSVNAIIGTVSGTSISFGTALTLAAENGQWESAAYDSTNNKVLATYSQVTTDYGRAVTFTPFYSNLTSENFIGISNAAYTNGQTATIQIVGSVDDAQSGLTAGQTYYVQADGTLGLSADSPSVVAGTAVSATKLIIKG